jgi:23S rRNA pseudouridine2605 synthase
MTAVADRVSLARALSKLGVTSRSVAAAWIRQGRVTLNGRIVRLPSTRCSPRRDTIRLDGRPLARKEAAYVLLHKPAGVVTTRSDERGRRTVYDLLGDLGQWLFPVGRLDKETSGLLILTNDTRLGEALTSPSAKVWKTYEVETAEPVSEELVRRLREPMALGGEALRPARVRKLSATSIAIEIHEGKNRQVRRMCQAAGATVTRLVRTRIGGLRLGSLRPGEWKQLSETELRAQVWPKS